MAMCLYDVQTTKLELKYRDKLMSIALCCPQVVEKKYHITYQNIWLSLGQFTDIFISTT